MGERAWNVCVFLRKGKKKRHPLFLFMTLLVFSFFKKSESESEVAQSCQTLCDPMDCQPYHAALSMRFSRQDYWSGLQ